ncbi:mannitol dehydrogenase family protein [Francisella marina]|uniref:Mannitol dehydrogenase family protein n=1 Tax=Francisella marina TaxID=2249302 RepID=A0ABX5ZF60_9GAMM|nr:mannitol dehydrogenase family protein [Francisella marina]QEO56893.1 mannitol dehydrogenase family protein [Francisella marina]QEO58988.1 mannitol dehydrogenase family protein [Francisella marina]
MLNLQKLHNCSLPNYQRTNLKPGILHIGIGAFHRAHQVFYIDKLLNTGNQNALNWGYISGTIRTNQKLIDDLKANDCLYTLSTNDESGTKNTIVGALKDVYFAGNGQSQNLITQISDPNIKIITYTVTEKGYYVDLSTQELNFENPDIAYDLANINSPKTAIGITIAGLYKRWQENAGAITLLSCDNMPNNGKILKKAILDFSSKIDMQFSTWVAENVSFPSSMVDRIVPAITQQALDNIENMIGQKDISAVATEEFSQWVIEDDFVNGRPALEKVGVEFVKDIEPFEKLKLTMLNGSHSLIAYLGAYAGLKTVDEVISQYEFYTVIRKYMLEIAAPLVDGLPQEISTSEYADKLLNRFANPHLKHRTEQIAMDGSKKIPQRWLGSLVYLLENKQNYDILALGLAGWILFCSGKDQHGKILEISDPLQNDYKLIYQENIQIIDIVNNFLSLKSIFPETIATNKDLKEKIVFFIEEINKNGVIKTLTKLGE